MRSLRCRRVPTPRSSLSALVACACVLLSGCGHKSSSSTSTVSTYSIAGVVSGLNSGAQLTLNQNGGDALTVSANGTFRFSQPMSADGSYLVAVVTQPVGETCAVSNYTGSAIRSNVTNVTVVCSVDTYALGGTVTGLGAGTQVMLEDNGGDALTVAANGGFTFATPVSYQGGYNVTVGTQPAGQTCTVAKGTGTSVVSAVTSVAVVCAKDTFTIGGAVTGLTSGSQVTLLNDGANPLTTTEDGSFSFSTPVASSGAYNVTVGTQPAGQTCTVSNGSGIASAMNVTNVAVACATNTYTIGGSVSNLASGGQLVLKNNGGDPLAVTGNGSFVFDTPIAFGGSFDVTVGTQPIGQTCTVAGGVGGPVSSNAMATVLCAVETFPVSGSIRGLTSPGLVLKNNGDDALAVSAGSTQFQFATPVAYGSDYSVTVFQQPLGEICTVRYGSSSAVSGPVTEVFVSCQAAPPTISCSATPSVVLSGDSVTINAAVSNPANRQLAFSYSSTAGSISGSSAVAMLSTAGAAPGTIEVDCNVVNDLGQTATSSTTVTVLP